MTLSALEGLRIVQLGGGVSSSYAGRLLASLGADVLAVRPRQAAAARFPDLTSAVRDYLDAGARRTTVDLDAAADRDRVAQLCREADVVVEDLGSGGLEGVGLAPAELRIGAPRLAVVRVSLFGQTGAAEAPSSPLTRQAAAGWVNRHDARDREGVPFQVGGSYADIAAGSFVAAASLAAVQAADRRGVGEDVEVSLTACLHSMLQRTRMRLDYMAEMGLATSGVGHQALAVHRCQDGWVGLNVLTGQQWVDACSLLGLPEYEDLQAAIGQDASLRERFEKDVNAWCAGQRTADVVDRAQLLRIPASPLSDGRTVSEILQWRERPFFVPRTDRPGPGLEPGPPFRPTAMELRAERVREIAPAGLGWESAVRRPPPAGSADPSAEALAGLRIVDFGNFYAAPYGTQFLGALGADVIKVESTRRPDGFRFVGTSPAMGVDWHERSMLFQATNLNKRSITVDVSLAEGRELILRLVEVADLVTENFSARVMDNLGLSYDVLRERNERLIVLRMPGYGLSGPWRDFVGFGPGFEQTAGLAGMTGFPDDAPSTPGGYLDPVVGMHAVTAILAGLDHRARTGLGQLIEIAQAEVAVGMNVEQVLRAGDGEVLVRRGNRALTAAPQGVYPCRGGSGWLALTVADDTDWQHLRRVLGDPTWAADPVLAEAPGRMAAHDRIDALLSDWTSDRDGQTVVDALLDEGIPAATVLAPATYLEDSHLAAWGYYQAMEHPVTGARDYPGLPFRAAYVPHHRSRPPLLGEHTAEVLTDLLGLTPTEQDDLAARAVIGTLG